MIRLEIKHLQAIHAIANTGNGTHAARILCISQSALSHRLQEAERRLGVKIYRQAGNQLILTAEGERLNKAAINCLEEMQQAEDEINLRKNDIKHVVRMGSTMYTGFHWLPQLIANLRTNDTGIEVEIITDLSQNLVDMLNQSKIDLAILSRSVESRKLKSTLLYRDELLALLPANHQKAGNEYFTARDFEEEVFITETTEHEHMGANKTIFEYLGAQPKRIMHVGHREAAITIVSSGMGMTTETHQNLALFKKNKDIAIMPITKSGLFVECHLATSNNLAEESPVRMVIDTLIDCCI